VSRIETLQAGRPIPTRLFMRVADLSAGEAAGVAQYAVTQARQLAPRVTGESSGRFTPLAGDGYFGIAWADHHVWYVEMGIRPFTMNNLAGKTIPMWITDHTGVERQRNPRARTRTTHDGRVQVLIFRKAARHGERKTVRRETSGGRVEEVDVPRSYPGAPGRISRREGPAPFTDEGKVAGQIAKGNIGVRWRHSGTWGRFFLREGLIRAAEDHGLEVGSILYASEGSRQPRLQIGGRSTVARTGR
jgi:hypothetical protein